MCPIETPEGPNIGLINTLSTLARMNRYGFIETPYRRVESTVSAKDVEALIGRTVAKPFFGSGSRKAIARTGDVIGKALANEISRAGSAEDLEVRVRPVVTNEIVYLTADEEELCTIGQATIAINEDGEIEADRVSVRKGELIFEASAIDLDFVDSSPQQIVSVPTAMIPFLEHDDANRALMGANMQRQAVPLIQPTAPLVSTGMELSLIHI